MGYTRCVDCNDTISPDITTPVSVFHHFLQPTVPSFHHSFTISALAFHQTWHLQPLYFTISCNLLCYHFTTPFPFQHLHFTRPGMYNLHISPFLATCCTTISPPPCHFNGCISPDLAFTTSIFHHFLQYAVLPFHHSLTISALEFHQTWHLQPPYFTISCNMLYHHFTTSLPF